MSIGGPVSGSKGLPAQPGPAEETYRLLRRNLQELPRYVCAPTLLLLCAVGLIGTAVGSSIRADWFAFVGLIVIGAGGVLSVAAAVRCRVILRADGMRVVNIVRTTDVPWWEFAHLGLSAKPWVSGGTVTVEYVGAPGVSHRSLVLLAVPAYRLNEFADRAQAWGARVQ